MLRPGDRKRLSELRIEPADDIESAKARLRVIGATIPRRYIIFTLKTGNRRFFTVDESGDVSEGVD